MEVAVRIRMIKLRLDVPGHQPLEYARPVDADIPKAPAVLARCSTNILDAVEDHLRVLEKTAKELGLED